MQTVRTWYTKNVSVNYNESLPSENPSRNIKQCVKIFEV